MTDLTAPAKTANLNATKKFLYFPTGADKKTNPLSVDDSLLRKLEANAYQVVAEVSLNDKEVEDRIAIRDADYMFPFGDLSMTILQEIIFTNDAALCLVIPIFEAGNNETTEGVRIRIQAGEMIAKFCRRFCFSYIASGADIKEAVRNSQELRRACAIAKWMDEMQDEVRSDRSSPALLN